MPIFQLKYFVLDETTDFVPLGSSTLLCWPQSENLMTGTEENHEYGRVIDKIEILEM